MLLDNKEKASVCRKQDQHKPQEVHLHFLCNYATGCINHASCQKALLETESSADVGAKTT